MQHKLFINLFHSLLHASFIGLLLCLGILPSNAQAGQITASIINNNGRCLTGSDVLGGNAKWDICDPSNIWQQWAPLQKYVNGSVPQSAVNSAIGYCISDKARPSSNNVTMAICDQSTNVLWYLNQSELLKINGKCLGGTTGIAELVNCEAGVAVTASVTPKILSGAINCIISDVLSSTANSQSGFTFDQYGYLNFNSGNDKFNLLRLSWGPKNGRYRGKVLDDLKYYLIQNQQGYCLSRAAGIASCDVSDPYQRYSIDTKNSDFTNWINTSTKSRAIDAKRSINVSGYTNNPLPTTVLKSPDQLKNIYIQYSTVDNAREGYSFKVTSLGFPGKPYAMPKFITTMDRTGAPSLSCEAWTDSGPDSSVALTTKNYEFVGLYNKQVASNALISVSNERLSLSQKRILNQFDVTSDEPMTTVKLYDSWANDQISIGNQPVFRDLAGGSPDALNWSLKVLKAIVPDIEGFSKALRASDYVKDKAVAASNALAIAKALESSANKGRSLLFSSEFLAQSVLNTNVRATIKITDIAGAGVRLPFGIVDKGNVRISVPLTGKSASTRDQRADISYNYSDFLQNKNNGVFNFVITLEMDKNLTKAIAPLSKIFTYDVGAELHFAFSVNDYGYGDKTRLDSIALNGVFDVGVEDGLNGPNSAIGGAILNTSGKLAQFFRTNRIRPDVEMGTSSVSQFFTRRLSANSFSGVGSNPVWTVQDRCASEGASSTPWERPDLVKFIAEMNNSPCLSRDTSITDSEPLSVEVAGAQDAASLVSNWVFGLDTPRIGLINGVVEGYASLKWFNKTLRTEALCRYNNHKYCNTVARALYFFDLLPDALEVGAMVQNSWQYTLQAANKDAPFGWFGNYLPKFTLIAPRFQNNATGAGWIAFSDDSADTMRQGAGQATMAGQ